jgi:hypothetical protein
LWDQWRQSSYTYLIDRIVAPRYLQGAIVERMTFTANRAGATLTDVTVTVSLSDEIAPLSVAEGVRLAVLDGPGATRSSGALLLTSHKSI